jgi:hypothetical protein
LTRWNWRVSLAIARRLNSAVKDGEATAQRRAASFTALFKHFTIEPSFCVSRMITKSVPKPLPSSTKTNTEN